MNRRHVFTVAALFAVAAVVGFTALGRTVHLGAASRHANDAAVAAKTKQLNAFERSLHRQLAAAPKVPAAATSPAPASHAQRVVYVRPAPIVVHKHRAGGETESERGNRESESGGFDD